MWSEAAGVEEQVPMDLGLAFHQQGWKHGIISLTKYTPNSLSSLVLCMVN
jgi:hypothetical protein